VFLVGEVHSNHTKCTGILDALQSLVDENDELPRPIKFDLMLELLQDDRSTDFAEYANEDQMNSVRRAYMPCVEDRDCNMRVHWTDPSESKQIPEWLVRIQSFVDVEDWKPDKLISSELRSPKDLIKILTENPVVMKEVDKASKVMPRFNRDFAAKIFLIIYRELSKKNWGWGYIVESLSRVVVDLYTVARIIKSQMTHVIYYAGNSHTGWCKHIFVYLGFVTKKTVVGTCVERWTEKPRPNQRELTANTPHLVQQKFRERLTRKEDEARWAAIQRNSRTAPNKYTRKSKENVGLLTRLSNLWK
jgi:hypothetical protein